jgi:hypothetical protein
MQSLSPLHHLSLVGRSDRRKTRAVAQIDQRESNTTIPLLVNHSEKIKQNVDQVDFSMDGRFGLVDGCRGR